jgi:AraC family transcriptional regulator of adaptative response/methylated-DNA-[protein]-cysteine methyltransferase
MIAPGSARDYARIEAAIRYIDDHAAEQPTLAEMAAAVRLSEHHFHRLFREWAGITPKRFLQLLTLEHARRRLEESRSVLEASFRTGLSGPSRLHDLFVTLEGVTPGEHRAGGAGVTVRWGVAPTPFGQAVVAATDRGVCHLSFVEEDGTEAGPPTEVVSRWPDARLVRDDQAAGDLAGRIFEGGDVSLDVRGTNFQVQVWQALLRIPAGAVASYGDVAAAVGRPEAVRAVAGAVAANRVGWLIPCHRVIRKVGEAGGYRWGTVRKRAMLAREAGRAE